MSDVTAALERLAALEYIDNEPEYLPKHEAAERHRDLMVIYRAYLAGADWTSELPRVPGLYWWRLTPTSKPQGVNVPEGGPMAGMPGEWSGPINPPAHKGE